ncbi:MAG: integrase core domain-containing protein [Armatimonadetes bacterium]|nr:integrase core domain-containing protein [Armatimonadota bacterium]
MSVLVFPAFDLARTVQPTHPSVGFTPSRFFGRETFLSVAEVRIGSERYRRHSIEERPHSSLAYKTPLEFKEEGVQVHPPNTHQ